MILWPAVSLRVGLMETGHWLGMDMAGFCISFAMYREEGHTHQWTIKGWSIHASWGSLTGAPGTVSLFVYFIFLYT